MADKLSEVGSVGDRESQEGLEAVPKSVLERHLMASFKLTQLLPQVGIVGVKGLLLETTVD